MLPDLLQLVPKRLMGFIRAGYPLEAHNNFYPGFGIHKQSASTGCQEGFWKFLIALSR